MRKKHSAPWTMVVIASLMCGSVLAEEISEHARAVRYGARLRTVLQVFDADGAPVADADVWAGFPCHSTAKSTSSTGRTDTNGVITLEGISSGELIFRISKDGYYGSENSLRFRDADLPVADGCWQPWGHTNAVVLKEKRGPAAMYSRSLDAPIPVADKPVGFDLQVGDWTSPHGKGAHADLLFQYQSQVEDPWTFSKSLRMYVTNGGDGLQVCAPDQFSEFRSLYVAPSNAYDAELLWTYQRTTNNIEKSGPPEGTYLIFRVRSQQDRDGHITAAQYGKIYGPIQFGYMAKQHRMILTYYLNPTPNDRNLEFDPSRNLFKDLSPLEQVRDP